MTEQELREKIKNIILEKVIAEPLDASMAIEIADALIAAGYRKASDVIDEFVERVNLIECEMFHKAHDSRNYYEYKINNGNTEDRVWGGKRECDGKMIALQDFMTKIEKLAAQMQQEVEK